MSVVCWTSGYGVGGCLYEECMWYVYGHVCKVGT